MGDRCVDDAVQDVTARVATQRFSFRSSARELRGSPAANNRADPLTEEIVNIRDRVNGLEGSMQDVLTALSSLGEKIERLAELTLSVQKNVVATASSVGKLGVLDQLLEQRGDTHIAAPVAQMAATSPDFHVISRNPDEARTSNGGNPALCTGSPPHIVLPSMATASSPNQADTSNAGSSMKAGTNHRDKAPTLADLAATAAAAATPAGAGAPRAWSIIDGASLCITPVLSSPTAHGRFADARRCGKEKYCQRALPPPADPSNASENTPLPPDDGVKSTVIVAQFDSSMASYCTHDAGVRLNVRWGCLEDGLGAGPITTQMPTGYLVECEGRSWLVSVVVDCQPSGLKFDAPLDLDFRVGEELNKEDGSADENFDLDEYLTSLRDTYKVLEREEDGDPWNCVEGHNTEAVYERGTFFVRARIHHFSQRCLAKSVQLENAIHEDPVTWPSWAPPKKKQVGFVNVTNRPLIFLVYPTSWSNEAVVSMAMGVAFEGLEANSAISKVVQRSVLTEATHPQVMQVPCTKRKGNPRVGQVFPFATCSLPKATGSEARVALITADSDTVEVWDYRIVQQRTWVWVLPGQFSEGMLPLLGRHRRHDLPRDATCLMDVALMATARGLQSMNRSGPVSTI